MKNLNGLIYLQNKKRKTNVTYIQKHTTNINLDKDNIIHRLNEKNIFVIM